MNKEKDPPKLPLRFFRWFCHPDLVAYIEGDLIELFEERVREKGVRKAKWLFVWDVVKLFRPGIIRNVEGTQKLNHYGMFRNYVKIAFRVFRREKIFTAINVVGLTTGIWCSILVSLWIQDEMSFDTFHEKGEQIYHLLRNVEEKNGNINTAFGTAYPIGEELVKDFPEILASVRVANSESMILKVKDNFVKQQVAAVDPNFFEVFSYSLIEGNPASCLTELNSIVISSELADNHFKGKSAIGQVVTVNEGPYSLDFLVSGVFQKTNENSSIIFDALLPIDLYLEFNTYYESWGNSWLETYLLFDGMADPRIVNEKIKEVPRQKGKADWFTLYAHPLKDRYLYSDFTNGVPSGGRIDNVVLFALIGFFTLLIACFNFINLSTARAAKRSQSIGISKVIGAGKAMLVAQFMIESLLLVIGSVAIALLLTHITLPYFNALTSKHIFIDYLDSSVYLLLAVIGLGTLFLSGVYPALYLSSFKAVSILKKNVRKHSGPVLLRKVLVVFQFSLAIILVAGTMAVLLQMRYIRNKNLGLDKEHVLYAPLDFKTGPNYKAIKTELTNHVSIESASLSDVNFIDQPGTSSDPIWRGKSQTGENLKWFAIMDVDYGLLEMMDIELIKGRYFSTELASDTANFIINQKAAESMGLEHPVGEDLEVWGGKGKIIGVTTDFHFASLHQSVQPVIIRCQPANSGLLFIKTVPGKTLEAIEHIEEVFRSFSSLPFSFHFLDQTLDRGYQQEQVVQKLAGWFSIFAIIISCLGLLGMASYTAERRAKEIAIRRVLGARILNVMRLLFREYLVLIIAGFAIGVPVAWYWIDQWLTDFAYRIEVEWWFFAVPAGLVLFIAFFTISRITMKTATANPVHYLRNE